MVRYAIRCVICYSSWIMLVQRLTGDPVDEHAIELIAERVIEALRCDLKAIAGELATPATPDDQLTVEQVAGRLGVARSTVYAHWREWGGYKLGAGPKARIRFDSSALPVVAPARKPPRSGPELERVGRRPRGRRPRRKLLVPAPRLSGPLDEVA